MSIGTAAHTLLDIEPVIYGDNAVFALELGFALDLGLDRPDNVGVCALRNVLVLWLDFVLLRFLLGVLG